MNPSYLEEEKNLLSDLRVKLENKVKAMENLNEQQQQQEEGSSQQEEEIKITFLFLKFILHLISKIFNSIFVYVI